MPPGAKSRGFVGEACRTYNRSRAAEVRKKYLSPAMQRAIRIGAAEKRKPFGLRVAAIVCRRPRASSRPVRQSDGLVLRLASLAEKAAAIVEIRNLKSETNSNLERVKLIKTVTVSNLSPRTFGT